MEGSQSRSSAHYIYALDEIRVAHSCLEFPGSSFLKEVSDGPAIGQAVFPVVFVSVIVKSHY